MDEKEVVYTDENVTLSRKGDDYKLNTNSYNASIRKNKMTFNSFEFSVNYVYEGSAYAGSTHLFLT